MHAVPTFWWANMPKARQPYRTFLGFWMNTLSGERGNALTTSAPKIGRGSYLLVAPLGTFKSKTLTLPHRSSIVSPQNDAERSWEVFLILPMWARSNTCIYVIHKITVEFWKLRHLTREAFLTLHCLGRVRCQSRDVVNCRWGRCEEGQNTKRAEGIVSAFVKARAWNAATRVCFWSTHSLSSRFDAKRWYVWTLPN